MITNPYFLIPKSLDVVDLWYFEILIVIDQTVKDEIWKSHQVAKIYMDYKNKFCDHYTSSLY